MQDKNDLPKKVKLFIREYLVDLNGKQAAIRTGYSPKTAEVQASQLLSNPKVQAEVARLLEERHARLSIDADALLRRIETVLTVDARELTGHHIGACRYCWGLDHEYQWKTPREYREAVKLAEKKKQPEPIDMGGFSYRITNKPNQDCPECAGLGVPYVHVADTRDLSPEAQILYEGVEQTKDGLKILTASKEKALAILAKHKGLMVDKHEVTGKDGKPIEHSLVARVIIVPQKAESEKTVAQIPKGEAGP